MNPIVKVAGLGKQYRIGAPEAAYGTLRESIARAVRKPIRSLAGSNGRAVNETIWALKDVGLDVQSGEVLGIIGRNGAGKSTLLKILSRITEPTTGKVELYGRVGSLLEVGTGFHPELTGRENIFLNGAVLGMKRSEIARKFDEIVAFSEIERFIDTPVKRYSSGMYMRLAFAVAAHLEPEILIIDEVLSVGDLAFQKKCIGKMSEVAGQGRTVLFVSHSMEAVRKICHRAILLDHGEIISQGKTEDVITGYMENGASAQSVYRISPPSNEENPAGYAYKLVIEDGEGRPASAIPVGSPWQIRVCFKIIRRVEHFIIALGLWTNLNITLRASWSVPQTIEPGDYQAVFREETLLLASGRYPIGLGLSSFERSFHYIENAGVLQIADFAKGLDLVRISGVGVILNPMKIELQRSES